MTTRRRERDGEEGRGRDPLNARIAAGVLHALGEPKSLLSVRVKWLWGDTYRVNVMVGGDISSATIAHSFFLVADDGGNVLESSPAIARRY